MNTLLSQIPTPPGWTTEAPTTTGTYDFFGWVEGRVARGSALPSRVRIYAPNGVWQHATYEADFTPKADSFHGIWRRVEVTEAEAAYNLAWRVVRAAHQLELHRKEHPWARHVDRYTMGIPDSHEDMGDATLAALVEAGVLTPSTGVQSRPTWVVADSDRITERVDAWLRAKFDTPPPDVAPPTTEAPATPEASPAEASPPEAPALDPTRTCACWGPLGEGEYKHLDCGVIVTNPSVQISTYRVGPYPRVCTCECKTCKSAWWDAGRPRIVDGEVLRRGA